MGGETDAVSGEAARTGSSLSVIISPVGCRTTELCNSVGSLSVVEILDDREQGGSEVNCALLSLLL